MGGDVIADGEIQGFSLNFPFMPASSSHLQTS